MRYASDRVYLVYILAMSIVSITDRPVKQALTNANILMLTGVRPILGLRKLAQFVLASRLHVARADNAA